MKQKTKLPIEVSIGAEVTGLGGRLGEVSRAIVEDGQVSAVVVKRGLLNPMEYVIPLSEFDTDAEGQLGLAMSEDQLEQREPFDLSRYRLADLEYVLPPGLDATAPGVYQGTGFIALGPALVATGAPLAPPDWEPPQALQQVPWSSISRGADVVDRRGDKVGEVAELSLDSASGDASRVVVQSGFIRHRKRDVPLPWVETLEADRVVLRVAREEVEALPVS